MKNVKSRVRTAATSLAIMAGLALFGCGSGGGGGGESTGSAPTTTSPNEPSVIAAQITASAEAGEVVASTQKALTLAGISIGDVDQLYSPASKPAASGFISPGAAFNMALEQHNRATSGRLTVTQLGQMLKDFGWPFKPDASPGKQMMLFFSTWVTEAQKSPTNTQSFAPLFIHEMAKRQIPSIDLATGTGDPDLMRLTLLELELFSSAFDRASKATTPLPSPKMAAVGTTPAPPPCTQMKASFGQLGGAAIGFNWEQSGGEMLGLALKKMGLDEANVSGVNNALSALGTAARIWKLVQIYSSAEVALRIDGGNLVHKPFEGMRQLKRIIATAGIPDQDWQDYQKKIEASGEGGKFYQAAKDCMQTFGFPTVYDLGDIASSIDSWKIGWSWEAQDGGECGDHLGMNYPNCHFYFSRDVNPTPPWIRWLPPYKEAMTKTGAASAEAAVLLDINEENPANHASGREKTVNVIVKASALTAEPLSLSTFVNAAKGGLGLIDSLVELGGGWLQTMFPPSTTIPLTVTYHVPAGGWEGTASVVYTQGGVSMSLTAEVTFEPDPANTTATGQAYKVKQGVVYGVYGPGTYPWGTTVNRTTISFQLFPGDGELVVNPIDGTVAARLYPSQSDPYFQGVQNCTPDLPCIESVASASLPLMPFDQTGHPAVHKMASDGKSFAGTTADSWSAYPPGVFNWQFTQY